MDKHLRELAREAAVTGDFVSYDAALQRINKTRLVWYTITCQCMLTHQVLQTRYCLQNSGFLSFHQDQLNYTIISKSVSNFENDICVDLKNLRVGDLLDAFVTFNNQQQIGHPHHPTPKALKVLHIETDSLIVEGLESPKKISTEDMKLVLEK